jgi:pyridoxal phosphate enzyme (YggS family)
MNENLIASIRERYQRITEKIEKTAEGCGRNIDDICLVVVSKSQPIEVVQAAMEVGITRFGENYVEEAVEKIALTVESKVEWHMIGHLQSRKAAMVAEHFSMLHSLDSAKLARRLERFCELHTSKLPVLVEFNVSGEESKFGISAWEEEKWADLSPEIEGILSQPHLDVLGLMTMPPYFEDPEKTRPYFRKLRRLQEFLTRRYPEAAWSELSMGTSVDYPAAIQEGATFIRIGQAILGPRPH